MNRIVRLLIAAAALLVASPAFAEKVVDIESSRGVKQKYLLLEPKSDPTAVVLLFAGTKGALNLNKGFGKTIRWGSKNFLVRTRKDFARHGFVVAVIDAPADKQGETGMYEGMYRTTSEHVADIDSVIADLRASHDLPVWLVGTSRGTESAAYLAIHSTQALGGIVLTSSMTEPNPKGISLPEMPLERIRVPTLVVHHVDDGCKNTRPEGAEVILAGLTNAPVAELEMFEGGRTQGNPCRAMSHHGYLGIEDEVVDAIAAFIKANS